MTGGWPDLVIMVANFLLAAALLPSIFSKSKPAKATCLLTAACVSAVAASLAFTGLLLSTIAVALVACGWITLPIQTVFLSGMPRGKQGQGRGDSGPRR